MMSKNNKFSKEQEQQICTEYFSLKKLSTLDLAKKYNCSHTTIRNIIIRNGCDLRPQSETKKIFTKEKELQICKEYFSKKKPSTYILAKKWNCTSDTIWHILKRNGFDPRTRREVAILRHQTHPGPYKDTKPELILQNIFNELHIPYEKQFRLDSHLYDGHIINSPFLIEVDGDYWHSNPKKFSKLNKTQEKNKQRDLKKNKVAKENNYILLRFWESDILKNKKKVIKRLNELKKI